MPAAGLFVVKVGDAHVFLSPATKDHGEAARLSGSWPGVMTPRSLSLSSSGRLVTFSQPRPREHRRCWSRGCAPSRHSWCSSPTASSWRRPEAGAERASLFTGPARVGRGAARGSVSPVGAARTGSETIRSSDRTTMEHAPIPTSPRRCSCSRGRLRVHPTRCRRSRNLRILGGVQIAFGLIGSIGSSRRARSSAR
jgi:hypothetical protein